MTVEKEILMPSTEDCPTACLIPNFFGNDQLTVLDVMRYGVVSIDKQEPLHKAVSLLLENNISGLPVTHAGHLAGILSDKDLLKLLFESSYLPGTVADYMTCKVVSFDVEDKLSDISSKLVNSSFRRIPILHGRKIAGMVTRTDLIRFFRRNTQGTTALVKHK